MSTTSVSSQQTNGTRWNKPTIAAVTLGAALVAGNVYFLQRANRMDREIHLLRNSMRTEMVSMQNDARTMREENSKLLAELRQQLEMTGAQSQQAAHQASTAAKKYSEQLARQLSEAQKQQLEQQQKEAQLLASQLVDMRQFADQAREKMTGITSDVTTVKTDVASTRTELEKTIADLRTVRGDLGVQSGLIATNAKELAALRMLGERDYIEFSLPKSKTPQRVGDLAIQLKKFDAKRNRYTIDLIADDKKVEKKDRNVNEPVQFYVAKARLPYEIVVNEVRNDRIVGYLAAPKVKAPRQ